MIPILEMLKMMEVILKIRTSVFFYCALPYARFHSAFFDMRFTFRFFSFPIICFILFLLKSQLDMFHDCATYGFFGHDDLLSLSHNSLICFASNHFSDCGQSIFQLGGEQ